MPAIDVIVSIHDRLGSRTGVVIKDYYCDLDKEADSIRISGYIISLENTITCPAEPEVLCSLLDDNGRLLYSTVSKHYGRFLVNRHAAFSVEIPEVSLKSSWASIHKIELTVIYT